MPVIPHMSDDAASSHGLFRAVLERCRSGHLARWDGDSKFGT